MADKKKKKKEPALPEVARPAGFADLGLPDPSERTISAAESVLNPLGHLREAQGAAAETALRAAALRDMGPVMPSVVGQGAGGGILTGASAIANAILAKKALEEARIAAAKAGALPQAGFGVEAADIRNNPNYSFGTMPYRMYRQLQPQPVAQGSTMSAPFSFTGDF